jgi:plastocyanin
VRSKPPLTWILITLVVAAVALALWGRRAAAPNEPPEETTTHVRVAMRNFVFDPPQVTVQVGTTVDWIDMEGKHGVQFDESGPPADQNNALDVGGSVSRTFREPGRYPYHCVVHGGPGGQGMSGVVVVTP